MYPFHRPSIIRLQIPEPGGEPRRTRRQEPHPPSTVAAVRHLIETPPLPLRVIGARTGVDNGTVSRWMDKHGWTRPPGAWPTGRRASGRLERAEIGRVLAARLRVQAERLIAEIEAAERVDPAALAQALALLERARAEHRVGRGRVRVLPPQDKPELDPVTRQHVTETRQKAARKAWATRWARQPAPPAWMRQASADEAAYRKARAERRLGRDLPSPHLTPATKPCYRRGQWDRRAAAIAGWKRRYENLRAKGWKPKGSK